MESMKKIALVTTLAWWLATSTANAVTNTENFTLAILDNSNFWSILVDVENKLPPKNSTCKIDTDWRVYYILNSDWLNGNQEKKYDIENNFYNMTNNDFIEINKLPTCNSKI